MYWLKRFAPAAAAAAAAPVQRHVWCAQGDAEAPVCKRPAARQVQVPKDMALGNFTVVRETYKSRADAYQSLGVNLAIRGHKGMVCKTRPHFSLLHCKQYPNCKWQCALVSTGERWEQRASETEGTTEHNTAVTELKGTRGFDSLEHRQALVDEFTKSATPVRPRTALRAFALNKDLNPDHEDLNMPLKRVQRLQKIMH